MSDVYKEVIIICGPTSSGKTSLGLKLAKKYNGVIVSADSRQVYKHMNIGTGKVPIANLKNKRKVEIKDFGLKSEVSSFSQENFAPISTLKHKIFPLKINKNEQIWQINGIDIWGYDLVTPNEYFSAYDYAKFATSKISELQKNKKYKTIMLIGGTGFYIDIVAKRKKLSGVSPDFKLREKLKTTPTKNLVLKLTSLNPKKAGETDLQNKARLIRALEIELRKNSKKNKIPELENTKFTYIGLTASRPFLYQKVDNWLDEIWENGLLDEVNWLLFNGYESSDKLNGLVYNYVVKHIRNEIPADEAKQKIKYSLHAYIRRQQTYFKKNNKIKWFDVEENNFEHKILTHLKNS